MTLKCPRCSGQIRGWVIVEDKIIICVHCGYILRDTTQPDYVYSFEKRPWKYKIRHL